MNAKLRLCDNRLTAISSHGLNVITSNKMRVLVCPLNLQPVIVSCKWVNVVVEPKAKSRSPLVVLVLNPDIVDSSSMEFSWMKMAYQACLDNIKLGLMKMIQNHGTSSSIVYKHRC